MTVKVSSSIRIELHTLRYKVRLAVNTTAHNTIIIFVIVVVIIIILICSKQY